MKRLLFYVTALLVVGGGLALIPLFQARARAEYRRRVQELIANLESHDMGVVQDAVYELQDQERFLDRPTLVLELADHFSGRSFPPTREAVHVNLSFWNSLLRSEISGVDDLVTEPLARVRHWGLVIASREGKLDVYRPLASSSEPSPMKTFLGETLAKNLFLPPVPSKAENTVLLWDRANLEELSGQIEEAVESIAHLTFARRSDAKRFYHCWLSQKDAVGGPRAADASILDCLQPRATTASSLAGYLRRALDDDLGHDRIQDHWEFPGAHPRRYLVRLFDLVAMLDAHRMEASPDPRSRPLAVLLEAMLEKAPAIDAALYRGIIAYRRGRTAEALPELEQYLETQRADPENQARLVKPFNWRMGEYYLALVHFEAAHRVADELQEHASVTKHSELQQTRLELRLAQYFAELRFEREYLTTLNEYFGPSRLERPLLESLHRLVWGTPAARVAARDAIRRTLEVNPEILHPDDRDWWLRTVEAGAPRTPSAVKTLFRVGRIYEQKGDLTNLEQTIDRMIYLIEESSQQSYLYLLQALLANRRGEAHAAAESLGRLLEQGELPAEFDRGLIVALQREIDTIVAQRERIRDHLVTAEAILRDFYVHREGVRHDVLLAANSALLRFELEGPLLYQGPNWTPAHGQEEILREVLSSFDKSRALSYALEREWIRLRDSVIRNFFEYLKRGDLQTAFDRLDVISQVQNDEAADQVLELRGLLHKKWAQQLASSARTIEDWEETERRWAEAARYFKEAYARKPWNIELKREAILAYERAGDPFGIFSLTESGVIETHDREILLAVGKAHVETGNYDAGYNILARLRAVLWREDLPTTETATPLAMGNVHFIRDVPDGLSSWLEPATVIDPVNGVGSGLIALDASRQELSYRAPGDAEPGEGVVVEEGDLVRLRSASHIKSILVRVLSDPERDRIPEVDDTWNIEIFRRDFPLEPADAYLWTAMARILRARLPLYSRRTQALNFVNEQLQPDGDPVVQRDLRALLSHVVQEAFRDGTGKEAIQVRLRNKLGSWIRSLAIEKKNLRRPGRDRQHEVVTRRLAALERMRARLDSHRGVLEVLEYRDQQLQNSLRPAYVEFLRDWLERRGGDGLRYIETLARHRMDSEANSFLITLAENYDYRSEPWQGSQYLRGYQLARQAREIEKEEALARRLGLTRTKTSRLDVEAEARSVLTRLARAPGSLSSLRWTPRGLFLLGQLHERVRDFRSAHDVYDRIARIDIAANAGGLDGGERRHLEYLLAQSSLARADSSFKLERYQDALVEYDDAAKRMEDSPEVLWAHYQMGNCYVRQGRQLDGLREFQKGRSLVQRFFPATDTAASSEQRHWLTGRRLDPTGRTLLEALEDVSPRFDGSGVPLAGSTPERSRTFWIQLFDDKIQLLQS